MAYGQKCYGSTEHTEDTEFFIHGGQDFLVATLEIFGGNLC